MSGPLTGITVIELAGLGALPFGTLKLADMGADVIRVERTADVPAAPPDPPRAFSEWDRGRRSIAVDLKHPDGVEVVLALARAGRRAGRVVPARRRRAARRRSRARRWRATRSSCTGASPAGVRTARSRRARAIR